MLKNGKKSIDEELDTPLKRFLFILPYGIAAVIGVIVASSV